MRPALFTVRDRGASLSKAKCVANVRFQNAAQMHLAQDNDVVQTLTPDRSDQLCVPKT